MKRYFLCLVPSFFIGAVLLSAVFLGCMSPTAGDEDEVMLSSVPHEAMPGAASWRVVSGSDFGERNVLYVPRIDRLCLDVKKNTPSYILAYPLAADGTELSEPYGAIPPFSSALTAADGFASSILMELYCTEAETEAGALGYNIRHFNWQKFMELCRAYENPWLIERKRIIAAIQKGRFKKSDIKISR